MERFFTFLKQAALRRILDIWKRTGCEWAGLRVMGGISQFIIKKLKRKVNRDKSAEGRPWERKFMGFRFTPGRVLKRSIAPPARSRFKERIREITRRTRGVSLERMVEDLSRYLRGWRGYFGFCDTPSVLRAHGDSLAARL